MFPNLRKYFISGLVVFIPLALTVYLFFLALNFADGFLGKYLEPYFSKYYGFYFRGLGIVVGIYLIIVIGFLVTNFLGQKIHQLFERVLLRLPFFKQVYPAVKEMATFLFASDRVSSFKQAVLVEYPRKGIYVYGFLMNDAPPKVATKLRQELCNVFIPSSPSPITGFVILVPEKEIIYTDISVEETLKCIVSGGVVNPV